MLRKLYVPLAARIITRKQDIISTSIQIGAGIGVGLGAKELKQHHNKECPHENPALLESAVHLGLSALSGAGIGGASAIAVLEVPTVAMAAVATGATLFFGKKIMNEIEAVEERKAAPKPK